MARACWAGPGRGGPGRGGRCSSPPGAGGRGRGWRHRYLETGLPGWQRTAAQPGPSDPEREALAREVEELESRLCVLRERLGAPQPPPEAGV
jgi:hypothetical protein